MNTKLPVTGILMAGGQNRRMGTDKAFLEVEGMPLVQRTTNVLSRICDEVLISSNNPDRYSAYGKVITDRIKGKGPMGGIHSVLPEAKHDIIFITACDMPFIDEHGIRALYQELQDYDVIVPFARNRLHPLHAFYHKRILPLVEKYLAEDKLSLTKFLEDCRTRIIRVEQELNMKHVFSDRYFLNANTPQEWEAVVTMTETRS